MIGLATKWAERLRLEMMLKRLGKRFLKTVGVEDRYEGWLYQTVDWSQTKVVFGPTMGMNINLKGRDYAGTVEPEEYEDLRDWLIKELSDINDPETGLPLFQRVCRREDVYDGDALDLAPDVVIEMAEYQTNGRRWGYGIAPIFSEWRTFPPPSRRLAGEHSPEGVFLAAGPNIRPGAYPDLHIADLAPTIMYGMGLEVPRAMDGKAQTDIFEPAYVATHPMQYLDVDLFGDGRSTEDKTEAYEAVVTQRLRELGYIE
jgi:predicted AlkP superfamily phosphohydrolase/phosphomutase